MNDVSSSGQRANDTEQEGTTLRDKPIPYGEGRNTDTIGLDPEYIVPDHDLLGAILNQIRTNTLYPVSGEAKMPLQERIKKGAKLAVQQMEYVRLMEDRMKDMEKRLRLIENRGLEPEPPATNQPADFIMGIKRMIFSEYLPIHPNAGNQDGLVLPAVQHMPRHGFPGQLPYHLIDVVVSSMNQPEQLGKDQITKPAGTPLDPPAPDPTVPDQNLAVHDLPSVQPERIRINSTLLLEALKKITQTHFDFAQINNKSMLQDQVILRPFKLFVTFEQEIRDEVDRLEKLHVREGSESIPEAPETTKNESQNPPSPPTRNPNVLLDVPNSSSEHSDGPTDDKSQKATVHSSVGGLQEKLESRRCLEELLVVRELLDKDLKPTFDLRKQIKDGSLRSIAFQDLWHLFPIGSEIVSNSLNGQSQTYRILDVSGGKPFLCSRYDAAMDTKATSVESEIPKFEILSYFYDFDGKELGACQQLHNIKSYDGNKAITSLPCFPIIYSKHSRGLDLRDFFIGRGKRFLELTRQAEVVHKQYNGLTLAMDELREEVNRLRISREC